MVSMLKSCVWSWQTGIETESHKLTWDNLAAKYSRNLWCLKSGSLNPCLAERNQSLALCCFPILTSTSSDSAISSCGHDCIHRRAGSAMPEFGPGQRVRFPNAFTSQYTLIFFFFHVLHLQKHTTWTHVSIKAFFPVPPHLCLLLFLSPIFQQWKEKELKITLPSRQHFLMYVTSLRMQVTLPSLRMVPHICPLKLKRWEWFPSTWNAV